MRWHPDERWLELKLPAPLAHLANTSHGPHRRKHPPRRVTEIGNQLT
jgi:hypothetical protein